jgi:hypothetical protein
VGTADANGAGPLIPPGGWPGDPAGPDTPVAGSAAEVADLAAGAGTLDELVARQSVCRACPRLVAWREEVAVVRRRSLASGVYRIRIHRWGPDAGRRNAGPCSKAAPGWRIRPPGWCCELTAVAHRRSDPLVDQARSALILGLLGPADRGRPGTIRRAASVSAAARDRAAKSPVSPLWPMHHCVHSGSRRSAASAWSGTMPSRIRRAAISIRCGEQA